jgi:zinc protease
MNQPSAPSLSPIRAVLDSGAAVVIKSSFATPAVTINAWCRAGVMHEPADVPGLAHFLAQTIDRGTERRAADVLADALDARGVSLSASINRHVLTLSCTCLAEDFDEVLDIVVDVLRRPTFPDDEVARRRAEIVTALGQDADNPAAQAVEGVLELLYGSRHPYGRRPKGSVESIERISRDALVAFHREHVTPDGLSLVIVGDVDSSRAADEAARLLDNWQAAAPALGNLPSAPASSGRRQVVRPMMNKSQADIACGFTTVPRSDPRFYAFDVMNTILGQYGLGGRLGDNIRERQGMAYYVFSTFDPALVEAPLFVRAGVEGANVERTIAAIDEEITALARDGVTEVELTDTRQFLVGSLPRLLETNAGIATFLQTSQFFGLGLDHDRRLPALLQAVTREHVHEAARHLSPDRAAIVVAGPYREGGGSGT